MNIIDIFIIFMLLLGASIGFKRGFTAELISFIGLILIILIAYIFKNPISQIFYGTFPFLTFTGSLKGITSLNILLYEVIAFLFVFSILMVIFRILLFASKIFEKILKWTIILGIPSKLLGSIIGVLEYFIIVFVILFVMSMPVFNIRGFHSSKYASTILKKTPILSKISKDSLKIADEFLDLKRKYESKSDIETFNVETIDLFLKYQVISIENVERLIHNGKLKLKNADSILNKYRKGDSI